MIEVINLLELLEATSDDEDSRLVDRLRGVLGQVPPVDVRIPVQSGFQEDRGIVYVAEAGDDCNSGRSWAEPLATAAAAQDFAPGGTGREAIIRFGQGHFDIDATFGLQDGTLLRGISPHAGRTGAGAYFGSALQATAALGTDPMLAGISASGNLTSGGLKDLKLIGTNDANGGVGFYSDFEIADNWTIDNVRAQKFTSHGFHFDLPHAGNPGYFGRVDAFDNGKGGTGHGVYIKKATHGTVRFGYLGGDDNAGALLHIELLNKNGHVRIDNLKAERSADGKHNNVVEVVTGNGGSLSIGGFRVWHNVSDGDDPNALIKVTDTGMTLHVDRVFITEVGSKGYTYGFEDSAGNISLADFKDRPWQIGPRGIGMTEGILFLSGSGSPEGVVAAPVGSFFLRSDGGTGTTLWVKESGTDNTGWVAK